jgi:hypothetical protein
MIMSLTKPKFSSRPRRVPPLYLHSKVAQSMGIDAKNIMLTDIGRVIELVREAAG